MGQPTDHQEMGQAMNRQKTEGTLYHQQMEHPTDNPPPQLTQTNGYPSDGRSCTQWTP